MADIKVIFAREERKPVQGDLFAVGAAWLWAAEQWCAAEGLTLVRWSVDQRFMVPGELWMKVSWNEETGLWDVNEAA